MIEPLRRLAEFDRLRSVGTLGPTDRVLEIGSGDGRFLARLGRTGAEVAGIEPSPAARERSAAAGVAVTAEPITEASAAPDPLNAGRRLAFARAHRSS